MSSDPPISEESIKEEMEKLRASHIGYLIYTPQELRAEVLENYRKSLKAEDIHDEETKAAGPISQALTDGQNLINCDADPFIPSGLNEVVSHQKGGQFVFDPKKVELYLSPNQQDGKGNTLRKELADKPVLNANVLDYLLANPSIIPNEWKCKWVFFWGTIYRDSLGFLYVRCLYFHDGLLYSNYRWLGRGWSDWDPAALLAS